MAEHQHRLTGGVGGVELAGQPVELGLVHDPLLEGDRVGRFVAVDVSAGRRSGFAVLVDLIDHPVGDGVEHDDAHRVVPAHVECVVAVVAVVEVTEAGRVDEVEAVPLRLPLGLEVLVDELSLVLEEVATPRRRAGLERLLEGHRSSGVTVVVAEHCEMVDRQLLVDAGTTALTGQ